MCGVDEALAGDGGLQTVAAGEAYNADADANANYKDLTVDGNGGVFFVYGGALVVGDGCVFDSNTAGSGGAIWVSTSSGTVEVGTSSLFSNNNAGYVSTFDEIVLPPLQRAYSRIL